MSLALQQRSAGLGPSGTLCMTSPSRAVVHSALTTPQSISNTTTQGITPSRRVAAAQTTHLLRLRSSKDDQPTTSRGRPATGTKPRPSTTPQEQPSNTSSTGRETNRGSGQGPDGEEGSSFQIGLDPFSQQLALAALTATAAVGLAWWNDLDLMANLRPEPDVLAIAAQLSLPVLALLLLVCVPQWGPKPQGFELERLRQNYFMTAQVLRLYLDDDDDDDEDGSGAESERTRVKRRLRLDQSVNLTTLTSALALMQAYQLQPWNPPSPNVVVGLTLGGRTLQQLAVELLLRGTAAGLILASFKASLTGAGAPGASVGMDALSSSGLLFQALVYKVFGGHEAPKLATGAALMVLAVPGVFWEARNMRNFVRSSVVGPVRDAAIFCTGDGVNEPAFCDPKGFAFLAARRPANAAPVADVVTRTKGWRTSGSYSSVSSLDLAEEEVVTAAQGQEQAQQSAEAAAAAARDAMGSALARMGATVQASSSAFEEEEEDMGVLLRVETLQDTIAFWATAYYQLLTAFAINGAFLASDCNLLASFGVAWLLRTGPLVAVELSARARAAAAPAAPPRA